MIDLQEMTVLIVDDMPSMTKYIYKMMKSLGYGNEFFFANSGKEALDLLQKEKIDLILLDYNMPDISGNDVLTSIREDKNLRDTAVIMVTAEAYSDFVAEIGEAEVDAYILKPITMHILEEKITSTIEKANNPPPMIYHLKKAREFEDIGDLDSAIKEAEEAMEADPNVTRPIRELGYYHYKKNNLKEAEKYFLKAAKLNELDVFSFHYLGELYLKQKKIEKAAYFLDKAMNISPRHVERALNFGKTLVRMKMIPKAVEVFKRTLEISGNTNELQEKIIDFCIENGVYDYAVKLLESLVAKAPQRSDLLFKLGRILEKSKEAGKAVNYLAKASQIDKENIDIKIHLAKNYLNLNKPLLAEKPLQEVIRINPNNELAKELLKQCA